MKITEIQFTNYKAFYGNGSINKVTIPNGENLLIYGENGSGKSSVYWSLYTLLECAFKCEYEIKKYFKPINV